MEKELFIVRHGETDFNKRGVIQGRGVDTSLNETGIRQATAFFEHYKNFPFEKIYTSSLKRTKETVSDFAKAGFIIESFSELDEINWGIYEGKFADAGMKQEYFQITEAWRNGNLGEKAPEGESPLELQSRQQVFLEHLFSKTDFKKILLCIHGRAMRVMLCSLLGKSLKCMDDFPHRNLSLYKLKIINPTDFSKPARFETTLELFNDLSHLNGKN